jgi:hypothetical protein
MRLAPRFPTAGQPRRLARLGLANSAFWPGASVALDFTKNQGRIGLGYGSQDITSLPGWSFSRTGTEYEATSFGLLVPFASGVPAITDLGLQVWEARSSPLLWSRDVTNAGWAKRGTATATASAIASPDGTIAGSLLSGIGAAATNDIFALPGTVIGASARFEPSFYINKVSTSGTLTILQAQNSALGSWSINLASVPAGWQRITRAHPAVTINTEFTANAGGLAGLQFTATAGAPLSFYVDFIQEEAGTFSGPPIATTSASATRGAASASVGGLSTITETQGTLFVSWLQSRQKTEIAGLAAASVGGTSTNDRAQIFLNSTGKIGWRFTAAAAGSTINVDGSHTITAGAHKAALTWGSNGTLGYVDGASDATGDKPAGSTALDTLIAGGTIGTSLQLNDTLARVVFFPQQMSASQMASLTT